MTVKSSAVQTTKQKKVTRERNAENEHLRNSNKQFD